MNIVNIVTSLTFTGEPKAAPLTDQLIIIFAEFSTYVSGKGRPRTCVDSFTHGDMQHFSCLKIICPPVAFTEETMQLLLTAGFSVVLADEIHS